MNLIVVFASLISTLGAVQISEKDLDMVRHMINIMSGQPINYVGEISSLYGEDLSSIEDEEEPSDKLSELLDDY